MHHFKANIHFEDLSCDLKDVDIHIYVEDLSEVDAPPKILSESHLLGVSIKQAEGVFNTDVEYPEVSPDVELSMRIHVDTTGSGTMAEGDYFTTSVHRIEQHSASRQEDVYLSRI